jgi:hypothetical protein
MRIPRTIVLLGASVVGAALVRGGSGCSSEGAAAPADSGGATDAPSKDASSERAVVVGDDANGPSAFEGWDVYADYDPACGFLVPHARENLPAPIRWEVCRSNAETATKSCRQMVLDWKPSSVVPGELITPGTKAIRRTNGDVVLMTARYQPDGTYRMVAAADGPVFATLREQGPTTCVLGEAVSNGETYAYRVYDKEAKAAVLTSCARRSCGITTTPSRGASSPAARACSRCPAG